MGSGPLIVRLPRTSMTRFDPSAVPSSVDDQLSAINNEIGALNALEPAVVVEPEEPGTLKTVRSWGQRGNFLELRLLSVVLDNVLGPSHLARNT